jgi:hypothetical protein
LRIIASRPTGPPPPRPTSPIGYLLASPAKGTLPLYAAVHPVTGDQLLSTDPSEPSSLGYGEAVLLGHVVAQAPVTGKLGLVRLGVPWAVKFGLVGGDHERVGG